MMHMMMDGMMGQMPAESGGQMYPNNQMQGGGAGMMTPGAMSSMTPAATSGR